MAMHARFKIQTVIDMRSLTELRSQARPMDNFYLMYSAKCNHSSTGLELTRLPAMCTKVNTGHYGNHYLLDITGECTREITTSPWWMRVVMWLTQAIDMVLKTNLRKHVCLYYYFTRNNTNLIGMYHTMMRGGTPVLYTGN